MPTVRTYEIILLICSKNFTGSILTHMCYIFINFDSIILIRFHLQSHAYAYAVHYLNWIKYRGVKLGLKFKLVSKWANS